jgi:hypothetical protein
MTLPTELRARIEADYEAVRPLAAPRVRATALLPLAALALLAAPTFFNVRSDAERIGWLLTWGASLGQVVLGFIVITAALRESIPGRGWSTAALAAWIVIPFVALTAITFPLRGVDRHYFPNVGAQPDFVATRVVAGCRGVRGRIGGHCASDCRARKRARRSRLSDAAGDRGMAAWCWCGSDGRRRLAVVLPLW